MTIGSNENKYCIDFNISDYCMKAFDIIGKTSCPYCGTKNISRYGYTSKGRKRYICKKCERTFCDTTATPVYNSKKSLSEWIQYIKCMSENKTLRDISSELKISLTTSFQWRHKILNAVKSKVLKVRFRDKVEIGEIVMTKNYKGNHHGKFDYRDGYPEFRILSCLDNFSRMVRGIDEPFIRKENLDNILSDKIEANSIISTARNMSYTQFARENRLKENMVANKRFNLYSTLDNKRANRQGRGFVKFTKNFGGVATRYVNFYSNLYVIRLLNSNDCWGIFKNLFKEFFMSENILRRRDFVDIKLS